MVKQRVRLKTLQREGHELASAASQLKVLSDSQRLSGLDFVQMVSRAGHEPLRRKQIDTLQINVGKVCNQTCTHCHVDAGPDRRESMTYEVAQQVIAFLERSQVTKLDITGGAPEMNPNFRYLVENARRLGKRVIDRCNLTILLANGFKYLPEFLAQQKVNVVASLPCYLEENCDAQRGDGVFSISIEAIRQLNELGYGRDGTGLELDLVYNPVGTGLPPAQSELERAYREQLATRYGIVFNRLFTITNMPVSRFLNDLLQRGQFEEYMHKLHRSFNPATIDGLMCRSMVSVDWNGFLFDCDFNQMLELSIEDAGRKYHVADVNDEDLRNLPIRTHNHCFGCTSGGGSSCGGSLLPS